MIMTLTMKCPHCGKEIELTVKPVKPVQKTKKPAHAAAKKVVTPKPQKKPKAKKK